VPDNSKNLGYTVTAIANRSYLENCIGDGILTDGENVLLYDKNGELKNPGKWKTISDIGVKSPSYSLNPSPGGGCLLPFGAFCEDAVNEDKIRSLAYKKDDLLYMFMAAQNGTRIIKTRKYHKTFSVINGSQGEQMATENVVGDRNQQIMKVLKESYPCAYERIITDKDSQNEDQ
ncbi:MAG: hypothetical protein IJ499_07170, partial [Clostridia bacterium]|nr:hypothetical protein [Clostridia bacterium]